MSTALHLPTGSTRTALRAVAATTGLVSALGLLAELGEYLWGAPEAWVELFSLSYEANVPTWYASVLLVGCAAVCLVLRSHHPDRRWLILAVLFTYVSLDEAVQIHEHAAFFATRGVLTFSWVIPAAAVVALLGVWLGPWLLRLPDPLRRRFALSATLYLTGALGMELPLGWWTDRYGDDNLVYGLIDWVEETLELIGAGVFLLAAWAHAEAEA
ncbi:MAG TPA: hypothetical protein DEF51_02165 [Myxococcales bacterium]|nr:hypothetical protein [Myxococcales bacterium]